jgi:hypothetical protein
VLKVATPHRILLCIGLSALFRKIVSSSLQHEGYKGSLPKQVEAVISSQSMSASRRAFVAVGERFTPDIMASLARGLLSNLWSYHDGTISVNDAINKSLFSASLYTIGTLIFYSLYRAVESTYQGVGCYQKSASIDSKNIEILKDSLAQLHSDLESNPEWGSDFSSRQKEKFSSSFKFLDSPLASLFTDPLYRSSTELNYSKKTYDSRIEAFHALDAIKVLQNTIISLEGTDAAKKQEAKIAFNKLRDYLIITNSDVFLRSSADCSVVTSPLPVKKIDFLIQLVNSFSIHQSSSLESSPLTRTKSSSYKATSRSSSHESEMK